MWERRIYMQSTSGPKNCRSCNKILRGRIDKKFCDDHCRNSFNNQFKTEKSSYVRNINNWLLKNRRILEGLLPQTQESIRVNKEKLQRLGFLFPYHTHTHTNRKGGVYYYCYEYGYLPLSDDWLLVVKRKEEG